MLVRLLENIARMYSAEKRVPPNEIVAFVGEPHSCRFTERHEILSRPVVPMMGHFLEEHRTAGSGRGELLQWLEGIDTAMGSVSSAQWSYACFQKPHFCQVKLHVAGMYVRVCMYVYVCTHSLKVCS